MIKIENVEPWGFEHAIRGMRNPLNSWEMSDSCLCKGGDGFEDCTMSITGECPRKDDRFKEDVFCIGEKDMGLMKRLFKGGPEHRKYLRQIFVSMDITAPLYWWKEFDTYKVGTVANSCSTMHTIHKKEFTVDDFSFERIKTNGAEFIDIVIEVLNYMRDVYTNFEKYDAENKLCTGLTKKDVWYSMIQFLPSSYNQKRTVTMNYENVFTIIKQRTGHKLDEWATLIAELKKLPYVKEIGDLE